MNIEWMEPRGRAKQHGKEVVVAIRKGATVVVFYGASEHKITKDNVILVGISDKRMYFKEAKSGFHIRRQSKIANYVMLPGKKTEWVGEYDLIFDADQKLWYIQR